MKALALLAILFSSPALASSYVICGEAVNQEGQVTKGYELEISSGDDNYSGAVGGSWSLKLKEGADWISANANITASMKETSDTTIVTVKIKQARGASGPVGIEYVLTDLFSDEPKLEKFTMGGFTGRVKIGAFNCISSND